MGRAPFQPGRGISLDLPGFFRLNIIRNLQPERLTFSLPFSGLLKEKLSRPEYQNSLQMFQSSMSRRVVMELKRLFYNLSQVE